MLDFLLLIFYIFTLPWDGGVALQVAYCETGGTFDQSLIGDGDIGGSYGIFQVYEPVWREWLDSRGVSWYNVQTSTFWNSYAAYLIHNEHERVFKEPGFNAWSCYDND